MTDIPRIELLAHPTPIEFMPRLSAHLGGPKIYVKRDDNTGVGLGGNKIRKLEFLLADALAQGADTLITVGGLQSNHCRQTAAVAARSGMACHLIVQEGALAEDALFTSNGNILLDQLFGAKLHVISASEDREKAMLNIVHQVEREGRKPYLIPSGGSNALGALGYFRAADEITRQCDVLGIAPACIFQSTGSGGTQAGLLCGLAAQGRSVPVVGVSSSLKAPGEAAANIASLFREVALSTGLASLPIPQISVDQNFVGEAYGVPTTACIEAIKLCASLEGLLLDPVYTGKAMAGLIDAIRRGVFSSADTVIFLHTGGSPALFAYAGLTVPLHDFR